MLTADKEAEILANVLDASDRRAEMSARGGTSHLRKTLSTSTDSSNRNKVTD